MRRRVYFFSDQGIDKGHVQSPMHFDLVCRKRCILLCNPNWIKNCTPGMQQRIGERVKLSKSNEDIPEKMRKKAVEGELKAKIPLESQALCCRAVIIYLNFEKTSP